MVPFGDIDLKFCTTAQAISDASAKIKWAVDLKPNLAKLSLTKVTVSFV